MLTKDMKDLIRAFNANGVEYLIVGGFAFGVHAQPRATKDLDLFIRSDARNSAAVFKALAEYGAPLHGLTVKDLNDASTGLQIGVPPNRIDILQKIDGVTFEEAWRSRVQALIEGDTPTFVISREHLIQNKLASGRARDLIDVQEIRRAAEYAPKPKQALRKKTKSVSRNRSKGLER
jgi:hypothetical protein